MPFMEAVQRVKQVLTERGIPFSEEPSSITVKAKVPSGFDVSMHAGEETTVVFEGWHDHFSDPEEAVQCFLAGLSQNCRIRVTERGGKPHRWVLERLIDDQWVPYSFTGLLFFQFWRASRTKYLQNGI
jgi:hypothetical protein